MIQLNSDSDYSELVRTPQVQSHKTTLTLDAGCKRGVQPTHTFIWLTENSVVLTTPLRFNNLLEQLTELGKVVYL